MLQRSFQPMEDLQVSHVKTKNNFEKGFFTSVSEKISAVEVRPLSI